MTAKKIKPAGKTVTVIGIADCHGIESMEIESECNNHMRTYFAFRAQANRQRWAVVYRATLDQSQADRIRNMVKSDAKLALKVLRKVADEFQVEKGWEHAVVKIPDDSLDPFWSK